MFINFKKTLQDKFEELLKNPNLYYVSIDRDEIWEQYLNGFVDTFDKQYHTCNCCKSFLRQFGGIVSIENNKMISIWDDLDVEDIYKKSVNNLSKYIHSLPITDVFFSDVEKAGTDKSLDVTNNKTWEHFFIKIPKSFVIKKSGIDSIRSEKRVNKEVLKRSLDELTIESTETVLELISQNSLYRGKEFEAMLNEFLKLQKEYSKIKNTKDKDYYCWVKSTSISSSLSRIRNTAIGTLLINLSENLDLDLAVTKYEKIVAPTNYKRPTSLVTPKMIENAKQKLQELGLFDSLDRRYANETDININNVLYTDSSTQIKNVFDEMVSETKINPKTLSKVEEIKIEDFIKNILPSSKSIEVYLENKHLNNMVSLLTSSDKDSVSLFKWNNNYSWNYTGGVTDSIKERVKSAGGQIEGELRISLSWNNYDDLDLHVVTPNSKHIYYGDKKPINCNGTLDVDMNAGSGGTREPVENVIFENKNKMIEGKYSVYVRNFSRREKNYTGYIVQIECQGELYEFPYNENPNNQCDSEYITFEYSKISGVKFNKNVTTKTSDKTKWNLTTNQFHKVNEIMLSPNHWDNPIGNKHYMFFLNGCISDEKCRPFYNEFLNENLNEHRKVLEILSSKLEVPNVSNQLSGLGFSETQKNDIIVRVKGSFTRTLKLIF